MSYEEQWQKLLALWKASQKNDLLPAVECHISDEASLSKISHAQHSPHDTDTEQSNSDYRQPQDTDMVTHNITL